jgi:DNA-binding response OmpR family regulator
MNPARILIVDDDPALLLTVGDQLRLEGFDAVPAATGEEALSAIRTTPPDLIILDITMPGMTGLALLKKLSGPDGKPRYPVLIFTARANMEHFFETTGVEGFLAKTSDPSKLLEEIRRILLKTRKAAPAPGTTVRKALLIVEDDPKLCLRLHTFFSSAGYETTATGDSGQIVELLQKKPPSAILIKQILPGVTGSTIAENLADYTTAKGIRIVLYDDSGLHRPDMRFTNVDRFVTSHQPADLLKAVTQALTGG